MRIGFQGVLGAYSELTGRRFFANSENKDFEYLGFQNFEDIFKAIKEDKIDRGIIPIENSLAGSVYKNIDLLKAYDLEVSGEIYQRIEHNLLAKKGTKLEEVNKIYSHWQALAQCEKNIKLKIPNAIPCEYFDTAGSAEFVSKCENKDFGAIASSLASLIYDLEILIPNLEDDKNNYTRFLIINKFQKNKEIDNSKIYKTSIIFSGTSMPGFLYSVLKSFAERNINLTKIESRPIPEETWNYFFYVDFEGNLNDTKIKEALDEIKEISPDLKVLGSYPKFEG